MTSSDKGTPQKQKGTGQANCNIALVKYWGKRDESNHLPVTSSLSVDLPGLYAQTELSEHSHNSYYLNDQPLPMDGSFAIRLKAYLERFLPQGCYHVNTKSNIPISAGLASSAAGFAALARAMNDLMGWQMTTRELSILARCGSGSACRSLWPGFVLWQAGERDDGQDSHGVPLDMIWPELAIGILLVSDQPKPMGSREAMALTKNTSVLYRGWPSRVAADLIAIQQAIGKRDFELFGKIAEDNARAMHATMMLANPPCHYSTQETWQWIERIQEQRKAGLSVYFTQDAGPNLKLLFLKQDEAKVREFFPMTRVIYPFDA